MPGWQLNKADADFDSWHDLTRVEKEKWDNFQNAIQNEGMHPKDAAKLIGDSDYKCLQGTQYQIRLSRTNRATFLVDDASKVVRVIQVGGHT